MRRYLIRVLGLALLLIFGGVAAAWAGLHWKRTNESEPAHTTHDKPSGPVEVTAVSISEQALRSLNLRVQPIALRTYLRTHEVPGVVVDLPGHCDYSIPTPIGGKVSRIFPMPGDLVRPGDPLFTIRLVGESVQQAQANLYRAAEELRLNQEMHSRLRQAGAAVPESRLFEADQQLRRQETLVKTFRYELLAKGFTPEQVAEIESGRFLTEVTVTAPPPTARHQLHASAADADQFTFEVQQLAVKFGQQVSAGEVVMSLVNHHFLMIEGRVFDTEAGLAAAAAHSGAAIEVEFPGSDGGDWPPTHQVFRIRSIGNTVDPASRTLSFYVPLENEAKLYTRDGKPYLIWRYRPGQRVRLRLPVQTIPDVYVLPAGALVREGAETYVYRQSGDQFERRPVHLVYEDRLHVVLGADSSLRPGQYVVTNNASALERARRAAEDRLSGAGPAHDHDHDHD